MPAVMGHELPTPGNADSPKQRKHREQAIVIGTLVLIILTYMLVVRKGTDNPGVTSDASGFQPSDAGAGGGDQSALPGMIGGIPGQVAALEEGNNARTRKRLAHLRQRSNRLSKRLAQTRKVNQRQTREISHLRHEIHQHPKAPRHPVHVSHRTREQHPADHHHNSHPPTHAGKKASGPISIPFGNLHTYGT